MPTAAVTLIRRTTLAACLLLAAGCTPVFDLGVGDCFNSDDADELSTVQTLDCAEAHDFEVYFVFDYEAADDAAYPGTDTLNGSAETGCSGSFEGFVGRSYDSSELYVYYLTPSPESWDDGDREIVCSLYLPDEKLTGSMRNADR